MATVTMKRAFDLPRLVRTHQAGIWRYLRFLGCHDEQAEDLTQETFLAVLEKPFEDSGETATAAYLRTVARNLFLKSIRKSKRRPSEQELDLADSVWAEMARNNGGGDYVDALEDCLQSLNGRGREVIDLRYRDNRSRADMAEALGLSKEGVKTLLRRTKELLRDCVERKIEP